MTIQHTCPADVIHAQQIKLDEQQEKIDRLQAELRYHRTNLANGYGGETATDAEIAQAIIRAYPSRFGGIAAEMLAHLANARTGARKIKDVLIITEE